eukprot:9391051-Lingulodinium_polyedra.AAC.1
MKAGEHWLRIAKGILQEGHCIASRQAPAINAINARGIMLECGQTAEEYLELMYQRNPGPEAWGGERGLRVLGTFWGC